MARARPPDHRGHRLHALSRARARGRRVTRTLSGDPCLGRADQAAPRLHLDARPVTAPSTDVAFSPSVKAVQERRGSRSAYERLERNGGWNTKIDAALA